MIKAGLKEKLKKIKIFYIIKILSSLFNQFAALFLIYLLPPEEYGHLALMISIGQLMFVLTSGWSNGAVINLGSKRFAEVGNYKDIVYYRTVIVFISFFIISILFIILKIPIIAFILKSENYYMVYLLFLGYVLYDYSSQLLYPGNKDLIQSLTELSMTFLFFILTLILVKSISSYVFLYSFLCFLLALTVISFFFYFFGKQKFQWKNDDFSKVTKYSSWQLLSVIGIYVINIGVNYVLVFNNMSAKDIGLYNFAFKLFSGFSPFFALFGIIIPKWIYNTSKAQLAKELNRRMVYIIILLASMYLTIALCLKPFVQFIGKKDYLDSVGYFIWLLPAFFFMSYSNLMNTVIVNSKYYKKAQFAIIFQVLCLVLFSYPLVKYFKLNGALIATTLSYIVCSIYFYFLYKKIIVKSYEKHESW